MHANGLENALRREGNIRPVLAWQKRLLLQVSLFSSICGAAHGPTSFASAAFAFRRTTAADNPPLTATR